MKNNKITIEFHSLLKDIIKNFWVVVLSALIGIMGHYIFNHASYEPTYTSSATLAVTTTLAKNGSITHLSVANGMAEALTTVFTDPALKSRAAEQIGEDYFDGSISAEVLGNINFIEIKVTSDNPVKSYKLLCSVIEVHPELTRKIYTNVHLTNIRMPSVPAAPSNGISDSNRSLVVLACVTLSLTAIAALSIMRSTVKKESDFNDKIESKLIGTIAHENKKMTFKEIRQKKKKGLLIHSNAYISLRFSESFHKIAAKIEHMKNHNGDKVFVVTSVAENEGKSTCAANLAVSLADRGNKVILVDLDFKKPALYKIFDEEFIEESELSSLLSKEISEDDFKFRTFKKTLLNLAINTKPKAEHQMWITDGCISEFIEKLKADYDYIIIDTAPISLDSSVTDIIGYADKTIMIVRTDTVKAKIINDHISTISKISSNLAGCILNDVYMNILPFSITGNDESNYYGRKYGRYSHYGHYGIYGKYLNRKKTSETEKTADSSTTTSV